jgi:hypothetical protein
MITATQKLMLWKQQKFDLVLAGNGQVMNGVIIVIILRSSYLQVYTSQNGEHGLCIDILPTNVHIL